MVVEVSLSGSPRPDFQVIFRSFAACAPATAFRRPPTKLFRTTTLISPGRAARFLVYFRNGVLRTSGGRTNSTVNHARYVHIASYFNACQTKPNDQDT